MRGWTNFLLEKNRIENELNSLPELTEEEPFEIKEQIILRETLNKELSKRNVIQGELELQQKNVGSRKRNYLVKLI